MHDDIGVAYCAEAKTGKVLYEERLAEGRVYASTVRAGEKLYCVARDGRTFVLAAKPQFELLATNHLDDGSMFNASPAVADGRIYIRSDKFLYCIGN
jgi:outer membrane protein assembly factor BamB